MKGNLQRNLSPKMTRTRFGKKYFRNRSFAKTGRDQKNRTGEPERIHLYATAVEKYFQGMSNNGKNAETTRKLKLRHFHVERTGDFGMELDLHVVATHQADGVVQDDLFLVDVEALLFEGLGDLGGSNGPEKPSLFTGLMFEGDGGSLDLGGQGPGVLLFLGLLALTGLFFLLILFHGAARGLDGQAVGDQEVPGIALFHVKQFALLADLGNVVLEQYLHDRASDWGVFNFRKSNHTSNIPRLQTEKKVNQKINT